MPEAADLVVVGGGPGGYTAALHAARAGRRVLLVEAGGTDGLGGACLHVGCIPSKAFIELAEHHHGLADLARMGLQTAPARLDMAAFQAFKRGVIDTLCGGVRTLLDGAGVTVRRGRARFTGPRQLVVNDGEAGAQFIDFRSVVLATGSRPATLAGLAVDGERVLDSAGALAMTALPASVAVVGGGYIGLELGMALARLGVRTSIVEATGRLLPTVDARLLGPITRRAGELGMTVLLDSVAADVDEQHLLVRGGDAERRVEAEKIIVAVGRTPNTDELGLAEAGLGSGAGLLRVGDDRRLNPHVAAIGDLTPGPALAHKATAEAPVAVRALAGQAAGFDVQAIPAVVFSDPEIATVGLTEAAAREQGVEPLVRRLPLAASGRAATLGRTLGHGELVADAADGTVLGVHLVGPHASELIAAAALAIELGATVEDLALTVHPHPTLSEQLAELAGSAVAACQAAPDA